MKLTHWIDFEESKAQEDIIDVTCPATGNIIASVPIASIQTVDAAVASAYRAFQLWR